MQLSQFTDYALRSLMHAALCAPDRVQVGAVADAFQISRHHLVKVVQRLQQLGYVDTRRGRGGGFTLGRAPQDIRLDEVVQALEPFDLVECFEAPTACRIAGACGLQRALQEARSAFVEALSHYSLADLLRPRAPLRRQLGI
ncbi:MAG: Rrf2 family transcriptional regulator [bacterium]|nr:Rrf2 family transcriptional regulator [bacterium]